VPRKSFLIAALLAWTGIVAAMISSAREPVTVTPAAALDERWPAEETSTLKKQDRLPLPQLDPLPVKTETITPVPPPPMLPPEKAVVVVPEKAQREKAQHEFEPDGICSRGKIWRTGRHGWKSWRCRR
jgi:hypothetical protein